MVREKNNLITLFMDIGKQLFLFKTKCPRCYNYSLPQSTKLDTDLNFMANNVNAL